MITLKKREKILGIIIGGLLLLFFFNSLILSPLGEKMETAKNSIAKSQMMIRKYTDIKRNKEAISNGRRQVERFMSLSGNDEDKMSAILSKIEQEARSAGLSIQDMSPVNNSPSSKSGTALFHVQLRAESEFPKIFSFLYGIENSDILFKIEKINLSPKAESSNIIKMDVNILAISLS
jgi:hypothetical protein